MAMGAAAAVALALAPAPAASAAGETRATCEWEATLEQSYGLTPELHPSSFRSPEPGWIRCQGIIDGHTVNGTGPMTFNGHARLTNCTYGEGSARAWAEMPTLDGDTIVLRADQEWFRRGLTGYSYGFLTGTTIPAQGTFVAQPRDGSCTREDPTRTVTLRSVITLGI